MIKINDAVERVRSIIGNPKGKCYIASEAAYHLAGGKFASLTPVVGKINNDTHWWLRDSSGNIYDPTYDQFDFEYPYEIGRGCGFLTKRPSKKALKIIHLAELK